MSRGSSFDGFYKSMGEPARPDEGNTLAAFGKGFDWAAAKALGSKRDMPQLSEEQQAQKSGQGLDSIKGKTPSSKDLVNMQAALGKNIYGDGHSDAATKHADGFINAAIKGETPPSVANRRTQEASASHAHVAAARTAETHPHEQHVAANPHQSQKRFG